MEALPFATAVSQELMGPPADSFHSSTCGADVAAPPPTNGVGQVGARTCGGLAH